MRRLSWVLEKFYIDNIDRGLGLVRGRRCDIVSFLLFSSVSFFYWGCEMTTSRIMGLLED